MPSAASTSAAARHSCSVIRRADQGRRRPGRSTRASSTRRPGTPRRRRTAPGSPPASCAGRRCPRGRHRASTSATVRVAVGRVQHGRAVHAPASAPGPRRAICDGPSSPIETPAWEPHSRRFARLIGGHPDEVVRARARNAPNVAANAFLPSACSPVWAPDHALLGDVHLEEPVGRDRLRSPRCGWSCRPRRRARRPRGGGRRATRAPRRTPCGSRRARRRLGAQRRPERRPGPAGSTSIGAGGVHRIVRVAAELGDRLLGLLRGDGPCRATPPGRRGTRRRGPSRSARRSAWAGRRRSPRGTRGRSRRRRGRRPRWRASRTPGARPRTRRRPTRASSGRAGRAGSCRGSPIRLSTPWNAAASIASHTEPSAISESPISTRRGRASRPPASRAPSRGRSASPWPSGAGRDVHPRHLRHRRRVALHGRPSSAATGASRRRYAPDRLQGRVQPAATACPFDSTNRSLARYAGSFTSKRRWSAIQDGEEMRARHRRRRVPGPGGGGGIGCCRRRSVRRARSSAACLLPPDPPRSRVVRSGSAYRRMRPPVVAGGTPEEGARGRLAPHGRRLRSLDRAQGGRA